jgi:tetratricopeptide (TPR) repeat protein
MPENCWREVEQVLSEALELPADKYREYLDRKRVTPEVRDRVEQLLRACRTSEGFLEKPILAPDPSQRLVGTRLGPWRLTGIIGSGGMGTVYRAERDGEGFSQQAAVKLIASGRLTPSLERRFREERRILARLEHPNVARLIDGGVAPDGSPYLVMEHVEGAPIDAWCREHALDRRRCLRLFYEVCEAVQFAHGRLVVHCDLKPGNILVTEDGAPKLLDFGIARLISREWDSTATLLNPLTPDYASPEQLSGLTPGVASDVYSLGVLLHELLTGRRPYSLAGKSLATILSTVCDQEVERPGTGSTDLDAILLKALRKDPAARYTSVEQFAADIGRYLEGRPVAAVAGSWLYRARKFARRRAFALAAVSALTLSVAAGTGATWLQSRRAQRRFQEVRGLAHTLLFEVYDSISTTPESLGPRRMVADRAQQYLDRLARDAGDDSDLARDLAESYLRLGDVLGSPYTANLGDTAGATENYRHALALLDRENTRRPRDLAVRDVLAEAHMKYSRVLQRRGASQSAVEEARKAIGILESIPASADPAHYEKLSRMYSILAEAQGQAGRDSVAGLQEALETSRKSRDVLMRATNHSDRSWILAYYGRLSRIGYALSSLGYLTGDTAYFREALSIHLESDSAVRELYAANPERGLERALADQTHTIGLARWDAYHDAAGSLSEIQKARDQFQQLSSREPNNLELKRDLANTWSSTGHILGETGRRGPALEAARKALAIYEDLGRTDPASAENSGMLERERSRVAALEKQ